MKPATAREPAREFGVVRGFKPTKKSRQSPPQPAQNHPLQWVENKGKPKEMGGTLRGARGGVRALARIANSATEE